MGPSTTEKRDGRGRACGRYISRVERKCVLRFFQLAALFLPSFAHSSMLRRARTRGETVVSSSSSPRRNETPSSITPGRRRDTLSAMAIQGSIAVIFSIIRGWLLNERDIIRELLLLEMPVPLVGENALCRTAKGNRLSLNVDVPRESRGGPARNGSPISNFAVNAASSARLLVLSSRSRLTACMSDFVSENVTAAAVPLLSRHNDDAGRL